MISVLLMGCSKEPVNIDTLVSRNDIYYSINSDVPYSGRVFSTYINGQNEFVGTLKNGHEEGLLTHWYENGQKQTEEYYKQGVLNGSFVLWYENGQKKIEGEYLDGEYDGLLKFWYESGNKESERLVNSKDTSVVINGWWENGNISTVGQFKNEEKDGVWIYRNRMGKITSEKRYKNGELINTKNYQ